MQNIVIYLAIAVIVLIIEKILQAKKNNTENPKDDHKLKENDILPYKSKYLLTPNEYSFYKLLKPIADKHNFLICPKVRLADIVQITDNKNYMKWFAKISKKHIDFLICDKDLKPLFVLELDDKSHTKEKNQENDNFKNKLCQTINLPIKRTYNNKNHEELEIFILNQ